MNQIEIHKYSNEAIAQRLAQLYIERTHNFDKSTPETFTKLYKSTYEKIYSLLTSPGANRP